MVQIILALFFVLATPILLHSQSGINPLPSPSSFVIYASGCNNNFTNDDAPCLNAAISAASNAGGGTVYLLPVSYYTPGTTITVPNGVILTCAGYFTSTWVTASPSSYTNRPCAIYSGAANAVTMLGGMLDNMMIFNSVVHSPGVGATRASMESFIASYANIGVVFIAGATGGTNSKLRHVTIGGFATGISQTGVARVVYEDILVDATNCISISTSSDNNWLRSIHCSGTLTSGLADSADNWSISALANNGSSLWRVTTSAVNNITTGEKLWINPAGTAQGAGGYWTVTQIDTTHFDLQGSAVSPTTTGVVTNARSYITVTSTTNIQPGMGVTDSGSCLPASTTVTAVWRSRAAIQIPAAKAATCSNASDTLTFTSTAYTSGGVAFYDGTWRSGTAFSMGQADGLVCSQCFAYDFAIGLNLGGPGFAAKGESWDGYQYDQALGASGTFIHISNQNVAPIGIEFSNNSTANSVKPAFIDTSGATEVLVNVGGGNSFMNSLSGAYFLTNGVAIEVGNGSLNASTVNSPAVKQILYDNTSALLILNNILFPQGCWGQATSNTQQWSGPATGGGNYLSAC